MTFPYAACKLLIHNTLTIIDIAAKFINIIYLNIITVKKNINKLFPIITIAPYLVLGATDAREYAEIADNTYRFLPIILTEEEAGLMHADNERISVENWTRMIYFYREFIKSR